METELLPPTPVKHPHIMYPLTRMAEITHKCLMCRLRRLPINLPIQRPGIRSNLVYGVHPQDNMPYLTMDEDNLRQDRIRMGILVCKDSYDKLVHHILNN